MTTSLESLAFRVEVECEACWATLGVPSITTQVACACGSIQALDAAFWRAAIGARTIASILEAKTDALHTMRYTNGSVTRFGWGKRAPACEACKATIALDTLAAGRACTCGAALGVRDADELARAIDHRARFVVAPAPSTSRLFYLVCTYGDTDRREAKWVDRDVRAADAATATLTEDQYRRLAADEDDDVREAIARNHAVPSAVLALLGSDPDENVRVYLARNRQVAVETLAQLADDRSGKVREQVAQHDRTPIEVLARLTADPKEDVRRWIPNHVAATSDMLRVLARDAHHRIRAKVAKDPRTPADALAILAKDTDSDVEKALRGNPVLTPEIIEELKRG